MNTPISIDASPTKMFFVQMLVKDIALTRSIIDLLDNSIDGLLRLSTARKADIRHADHYVRISVSADSFEIEDNCGGIPLDVAREYAFRFGRTSATPPTERSIGQFGVGMKRALFKLGQHILIETKSRLDSFSLTIDLDEWSKDDKNWDFVLSDYERFQSETTVADRTTKIRVDQLDQAVSDQFSDPQFLNRLRSEIAHAHRHSLDKGLLIQLNAIPISHISTKLIQSDQIGCAFSSEVRTVGEDEITVIIYAGIAPSTSRESGWYIFCNGRQVVGQDKSHLTGWGEDESTSIPQFHPQYNRFKGYVFFDSANTRLLPWNTTKTGVDEESELYRSVRLDMVNAMRPVIDFLNELDREKDLPSTVPHPLADLVEHADDHDYKDLSASASTRPFRVESRRQVAVKPQLTRINFLKETKYVDAVRLALGIQAAKEVGSQTFDYYYRAEIGVLGDED
jgi:hypothetical protein